MTEFSPVIFGRSADCPGNTHVTRTQHRAAQAPYINNNKRKWTALSMRSFWYITHWIYLFFKFSFLKILEKNTDFLKIFVSVHAYACVILSACNVCLIYDYVTKSETNNTHKTKDNIRHIIIQIFCVHLRKSADHFIISTKYYFILTKNILLKCTTLHCCMMMIYL